MEQFRERFERWREQKEDSPGERLDRKAGQAEERVQQRAAPALVPDSEVERRQQAFRERYDAHRTEQEKALAPVPKVEVQVPVPEQKLEQKVEPEQKQEHQHQISRGMGLSL